MGLSQQAIALLENGKRKIDTDLFVKILNSIDDDSIVSDVIMRYKNIYPDTGFYIQSGNAISRLEITPDMYTENIDKNLRSITNFMLQLNDTGQNKAIEQVEMLTKIPEYRKDIPDNDQ